MKGYHLVENKNLTKIADTSLKILAKFLYGNVLFSKLMLSLTKLLIFKNFSESVTFCKLTKSLSPVICLYLINCCSRMLLWKWAVTMYLYPSLSNSVTWHHWGSYGRLKFYSPPLNLGPSLIPKLHISLNLSGRTFGYFRPPYQYMCRAP